MRKQLFWDLEVNPVTMWKRECATHLKQRQDANRRLTAKRKQEKECFGIKD